jgi:hypothetical protein
MHAMVLSRRTIGELIEYLSDDDIAKAGQNAGRTAPEALIVAIYGKITVSHVVDLIRNLSSYSDLFEYTEKTEGERLTMTLMHDLGHKWSLFIAHYVIEAFAAAGCKPKYEVTDRYVTFTI